MQSHYSPIGTIFKSNMGSRKLRLRTPMAFSEQDGFFLTGFCIGSTYVRSTPGMENGLETRVMISLNQVRISGKRAVLHIRLVPPCTHSQVRAHHLVGHHVPEPCMNLAGKQFSKFCLRFWMILSTRLWPTGTTETHKANSEPQLKGRS